MRNSILAFFLLALFAAPLNAAAGASGNAKAAEKSAIHDVITAQMHAFLAGDVDMAFTYASPDIKRLFGTPKQFGTMVRQGYPMVWRPATWTFLNLQTRGGDLWQRVLVRDAQGAFFILDYQMIRLDGMWKINAVRVRKAPGGTA